ncbi:hypothetical protein AwErysi_05920 [Erysipelotrichaceae bacterium]|nr:hypothetical protein AwErysi_05920 [Erysipelotrichaceae bacterium]
MMQYIRRFNFEKVYNMRELGGYPIGEKSLTKWGAFLRSDCLENLKEKEIEVLCKYGVTTVIDLRFVEEATENQSPLQNYEGIICHNISLEKTNFKDLQMHTLTLGEMYLTFLTEYAFIKKVFHLLAVSAGCVLFHCSAGKDRTGVISALLLKLVGVSDFDVLADYQMTATYLAPKFETVWKNIPKEMIHLLGSTPESMQVFLSAIEKEFGTAENYLLATGVDALEISAIKAKFKITV